MPNYSKKILPDKTSKYLANLRSKIIYRIYSNIFYEPLIRLIPFRSTEIRYFENIKNYALIRPSQDNYIINCPTSLYYSIPKFDLICYMFLMNRKAKKVISEFTIHLRLIQINLIKLFQNGFEMHSPNL